ncbi:dioxygenase family protein [Robertkochia flava]|uniref:dioxygenase family protein n=1 Tax=Robertkochia flava TaxID=3447986 RepID=UPI001CC9F96F|nr:intradiol ring-cleavage dioxygenase [Robertkochia marina]
MKRLEFLKKGLFGIGGVIGINTLISSGKQQPDPTNTPCNTTPTETRGPFPNKTPLDYVRENIIGNRVGIPLQIALEVLDSKNNCTPISGVAIDIWHCDNHGKYSEYGNHRLQPEDLTAEHFLRGRQITDAMGRANFISIFPGFYPDRAPHIHVEIKDQHENSLLITQIAFPDTLCEEVYQTQHYDGTNFLHNLSDGIFKDSLDLNMTETITGNVNEGYSMKKKLII